MSVCISEGLAGLDSRNFSFGHHDRDRHFVSRPPKRGMRSSRINPEYLFDNPDGPRGQFGIFLAQIHH